MEKYDVDLQKVEIAWKKYAENVTWFKEFDQVFDASNLPFPNWFVGGEINLCYNALDRHVINGKGDRTAIIFDSPPTNTVQRVTYVELLNQVSLFAGSLLKLGVQKGDVVFIYVCNVLEGLVAMFACTRIGAIHVTAIGGIPSGALAARIDDVKPKIIVTINGTADSKGTYAFKVILDEALTKTQHQPLKCIVVQRKHFEMAPLDPSRDITWDEAMEFGTPTECVRLKSNDPCFVLHTSGTTGEPKGILYRTGGFAVGVSAVLSYFYDGPFDVIFMASQLGWINGHVVVSYGPLINGKTSVLFEGDAYSPGSYLRVLMQHEAEFGFFNFAYLRELRLKDPDGKMADNYSFPKLKRIIVSGEPMEKETLDWCKKTFGIEDIYNLWGQTETSCFGTRVNQYDTDRPMVPTYVGKPFKEITVLVVDEDGQEVPVGTIGNMVIKLPLPPSALSTIFNNDAKYLSTYFSKFPGYYDAKDIGKKDVNGGFHIMGRSDGLIYVAGGLLPLLEVETAIRKHPDIGEVIVVPTKHKAKREIPIAFYTKRKESTKSEEEISKEIEQMVIDNVGDFAYFNYSFCVPCIPKTAVGKFARSTVSAFVIKNFFEINDENEANCKELLNEIVNSKFVI